MLNWTMGSIAVSGGPVQRWAMRLILWLYQEAKVHNVTMKLWQESQCRTRLWVLQRNCFRRPNPEMFYKDYSGVEPRDQMQSWTTGFIMWLCKEAEFTDWPWGLQWTCNTRANAEMVHEDYDGAAPRGPMQPPSNWTIMELCQKP